MELDAPPRQTIERAAAAPVEREEAARFAGGCAGDLVTLDDDRQRAASACRAGDRGADRATAADHDALARAHTATVSGSASTYVVAVFRQQGLFCARGRTIPIPRHIQYPRPCVRAYRMSSAWIWKWPCAHVGVALPAAAFRQGRLESRAFGAARLLSSGPPRETVCQDRSSPSRRERYGLVPSASRQGRADQCSRSRFFQGRKSVYVIRRDQAMDCRWFHASSACDTDFFRTLRCPSKNSRHEASRTSRFSSSSSDSAIPAESRS